MNIRTGTIVVMCIGALSGISLAAEPPVEGKPPAAAHSSRKVRKSSYTLMAQPPYRYEFQLEQGKGTPVCDAYVQRLKNTDFRRIPQCDRPENTSVPGFKALERVPLTAAEVLALYEPVVGWLFMDDLEYYNKLRANKAKIGDTYVFSDAAGQAAKMQAALAAVGNPLYFNVRPVDIDNDGTPDRIVSWKAETPRCGILPFQSSLRRENPVYPLTAETYLVVLNDRGEIDLARTRDLISGRDRPPVDDVNERGPVRRISSTFGVFSFEGEYYTDGFYPASSNLETKYQAGKTVSDRLFVFHRKNGVNAIACQIRWYDRPQK